MEEIHVRLSKDSYPIFIGKDILPQVGSILKTHLRFSSVFIVTNNTVNALYGGIVQNSLSESNIRFGIVELPDGEEFKSLAWVEEVYNRLVEYRANKSTLIVALGGGVVGDLAGFVAATFMRGVQYVQIPTSMIAQVDSSIGGKVAVNHPKAKNLIGAFYHPKLVIIDVSVLNTLPEREFRNGLAEVIKHGVIMDKELFEYMEAELDRVLSLDRTCVEQIVARSCKDKVTIVEQDERDTGVRAILNYGHTVGHGIEAATGYGRFRHGEAVAIGMIVAGRIAANIGIFNEEERQKSLIERCLLINSFPKDVDVDKVIDAIYLDKKIRESDKIRFVLPKGIGEAIVVDSVAEEQIREAILQTRGG